MNKHEAEKLYVELNKFVRQQSHSEAEWQDFYSKVIEILRVHPDDSNFDAVHLLGKGIWQHYTLPRKKSDPFPKLEDTAIPKIISAILENAEMAKEQLLCFSVYYSGVHNFPEFSSWWHELHQKQELKNLSDDTLAIGNLNWGLFDRSNWSSARSYVEPHLDHLNPIVRASAAVALANLYDDEIPGLPPILETLDDIKQREIDRPGVAGPFWSLAKKPFEKIQEKENLQFDELVWLLEIIEKRNGEEPEFSCLLWVDFLAYDLAANNVDALRRLFKADSREMAIELASAFDEFTDEFREILVEMGTSENYNYCSSGSCLLAYNYGELHPEGVRRGIVKEYIMEDAKIFWIEGGDDPPVCSAVIWPREGQLHDLLAWKWIDRLLPPDDRNSLWDPQWQTYDSVAFGYSDQKVTLHGNLKDKLWDRVIVAKPTRKDWMDEEN